MKVWRKNINWLLHFKYYQYILFNRIDNFARIFITLHHPMSILNLQNKFILWLNKNTYRFNISPINLENFVHINLESTICQIWKHNRLEFIDQLCLIIIWSASIQNFLSGFTKILPQSCGNQGNSLAHQGSQIEFLNLSSRHKAI